MTWGAALLSAEVRAQDVRPADLVAAFESTEVRPLITDSERVQAYSGLSLGGLVRPGEGISVPLGGGYGISERFEAGLDLGLGIEPFDVLERARAYGRVAAVPDVLAVQVGAWLPTESGENAGVELMLPVRKLYDRLHLFGQSRVSWSPGADSVVLGAGGSVVGNVAGPVWTGVDLGAAQHRLAGLASGVVAAGAHVGVALQGHTLLRARLSLPALTTSDETGAWDGLSAKSIDFVVVRRFGD